MRGALHVLATITLAPYFLLAAGFVLLGQAIGSGSLWSFFDTLLAQATWLIPWGMIGLAAFFLFLAALGLYSRSRWIAGALLFVVSLGSIAGAVAFPIALAGFSHSGIASPSFAVGVLLAALVIVRHKDNIARLLKGEERRFTFKRSGS